MKMTHKVVDDVKWMGYDIGKGYYWTLRTIRKSIIQTRMR